MNQIVVWQEIYLVAGACAAVQIFIIITTIMQCEASGFKTLGVIFMEGRRIPGLYSIAKKAKEHGVSEHDMAIIRRNILMGSAVGLLSAISVFYVYLHGT